VKEISPGGGVASEMAARPGVAQPDLKRGIIRNEDTASERIPGGTSDQQSPGAANEAGGSKAPDPGDGTGEQLKAMNGMRPGRRLCLFRRPPRNAKDAVWNPDYRRTAEEKSSKVSWRIK
jgi:hypothetical protein